MRDDPGLFIVFEGIDGSGKTVMAKRLWRKLYDDGEDVSELTREPTDGEFGEQIRILANTREEQDPNEMLELFQRDRNQHVDQVIRPALEAGKIVICDRYYYSTIAYQGAFWNPKDPRGIPAQLNPSRILESSQEHYPVPDLVIVLNCPIRVALARIELEGPRNKMFESNEAYLELVRFRFSQLLLPETAHISSLDTVDRTLEKVWTAVEPVLRLWQKQEE